VSFIVEDFFGSWKEKPSKLSSAVVDVILREFDENFPEFLSRTRRKMSYEKIIENFSSVS
jgi:hypothetical protein